MDFNGQGQPYRPELANAGYPPSANPYASFQMAAKRRRNWLWGVLLLVVILALFVFLSAVYAEIASRNAQLNDFLQFARQETSQAIIENELLSGLKGIDQTASSTPDHATSAAATLAGGTVSSKDNNRRLAEKSGRPQLGNASSSLVIVEFADFQCEICLQEFPIIRSVSNKYAKDIKLIFRNYPVIDQNSMMFAEAGLCAQEQGKFWPFHDRLYANQGKIASLDDFKQIAVMSGLNWNKLQQCVNDEKYKNQILEDMSDALDLGVKGTPTFFVNGSKLEGAVDSATWDQIISKYEELNLK